jgi:hypothetical protein
MYMGILIPILVIQQPSFRSHNQLVRSLILFRTAP